MDRRQSATVEIGRRQTLTADVTHGQLRLDRGAKRPSGRIRRLPVTFSSGSGGSITRRSRRLSSRRQRPGYLHFPGRRFSGGTVTVTRRSTASRSQTDITVDVPRPSPAPAVATGEQNLPFNFSVTTTGIPRPSLCRSRMCKTRLRESIPGRRQQALAFTGTPTASAPPPLRSLLQWRSPNATQELHSDCGPAASFRQHQQHHFIAGTPGSFSVTNHGRCRRFDVAVSNIQSAIPGVNIPANGTGTIAITGTPTVRCLHLYD